MNRQFFLVSASFGLLVGCAWFSAGFAGESKKAPSADALKNIGRTLAKTYTFEPFHPAMPDHLWMDAGNGRVVFLHFNKPVADPHATVIFVGEGIKGRFCAEGPQPGKESEMVGASYGMETDENASGLWCPGRN